MKRKRKLSGGEIKVDRMKLLRNLEAVSPGLSKKDSVDQGGCFAFVNKRVWTFNDEIACVAPSGLPDTIEGAVIAKPLLETLREIPDDDLEVDLTGGELVLRGKRHFAEIRMDAEVTLPVEKVERPGKNDWSPLHDDFTTAITVVQECAGKNEQEFAFTCVHIHPKYVEACDNLQLTRYRLKTGVSRPFLVKRDNIKHITGLDMTEFAETDAWVHFRNPARVQLSCRRILDDFPNLSEYLDVQGSPTVLPKGVSKDAKFAEIFSKEVEDKNLVLVDLRNGVMKVRGIGISGGYGVRKKVKYGGKPLAFAIAPKLLAEITKRHVECQISKTHLRVDGDKWAFVTCLEAPEEVTQRLEKAAESAALEAETTVEKNDGDGDE